MAEKIGDAVLELRTDTKKLVKGMDAAKQAADKSMQKMQARADKFSKFMKGALGIGGVVLVFGALKRIVGDLVTTYGVQETAETKLKAAIKATGKEASISADMLFQYASELQGVTTFGDEATISALAMLQQLGDLNEEGLKAAIPLVQDFAAAMDVDLKTAASLVGKTLGSTTNALIRYGVEIDMSGTKQEKLASTLDAMQKKFGGMAKQLGTTDTAALQQFNNALGDIKEEGGKAILDIMGPLIRTMTEHLTLTLQDWKATANLNKALKGEATSIYEVDRALSENKERLDEAENSTLMLSERLRMAQDAFDLEREKIENGANAMQTQIGVRADALAAIRAQVDANGKEIKQRVENIRLLKKNREEIEQSTEVRTADVIITKTKTDALKDQTDALVDLNIELEKELTLRDILSIMAVELRRIDEEEKKALEDKIEAMKDMATFLTGPFVDAYSIAFEKLGESLVEGGNALQIFREAFKETIAGMLDMLAKWLITKAIEYAIPWPNPFFNPVAAGLSLFGAAAAKTAAGVVRSLATGGDFITQGPQAIMVGDNPGGRERVSVTPVSSPNVNGPSQMVHVTVNFAGRNFYDDISRASENGDIIIHPRGVKR